MSLCILVGAFAASILRPSQAITVGMVTSDARIDGSLTPDAYRLKTLELFREDALAARAKGARLLVFPEFAFVSPMWSSQCTSPLQTTDWCTPFPRATKCDNNALGSMNVTTFAVALACTARETNMTLSLLVRACHGQPTTRQLLARARILAG